MLTDLPRPRDFPFFTGRIRNIKIVLLLIGTLIAVQLVRHCVIEGQRLFDLSERNFLFPQSIDAPRGLITDRHGRILAYNKSDFKISIGRFRYRTEDLMKTLDRLEELLAGNGGAQLQAAREELAGLRRYHPPRTVVDGLSREQALPVLERQGELPGLIIQQSSSRYYPDARSCAHVVGYTRLLGRHEAQLLKPQGYATRDWVGRTGLEQFYESDLRGTKGSQTALMGADSRVREIRDIVPARPGMNVVTTLDADLQRAAASLIEDLTTGSVAILMDPRNGRVLAMASNPTFDLNQPAQGLDDPARPRLNRAVREMFPPGSTMKTIVALAALELGWDPAEKIDCRGRIFIPRWSKPFRCHLKWGHGPVDLEEALKHSCNIYFYSLAKRYGERPMLEMARRFGLGRLTGIDLPPGVEVAGRLPIPDRPLYMGDRLQVAIGQWQIKATPLQMIAAYCALGNGGRLVRPHLLMRVENSDGGMVRLAERPLRSTVKISEPHRRVVLRGLWRAVNERGGTAYRKRAFPKEWDVFGKTATASRGYGERLTDDAWFIALAPTEDPEIAALVMAERSGHGGDVAAPVVKDLLQAYFDKYGPPLRALEAEETESEGQSSI
jgi:penicillin-binding protein 2